MKRFILWLSRKFNVIDKELIEAVRINERTRFRGQAMALIGEISAFYDSCSETCKNMEAIRDRQGYLTPARQSLLTHETGKRVAYGKVIIAIDRMLDGHRPYFKPIRVTGGDDAQGS